MREFVESQNLDDIPSKELMLEEWEKLWNFMLANTKEHRDHADIIRLRPFFFSTFVTAWARAKSDSIQKMIKAGEELRRGINL